jgi:hypothetical protein
VTGRCGGAAVQLRRLPGMGNLPGMNFISMILAGVGAVSILTALGGISLIIGGLVNAMIVLMAGPLIDRWLARRSRGRTAPARR